ncbi:MAG: pilin [Patescibacteria group bacterium]
MRKSRVKLFLLTLAFLVAFFGAQIALAGDFGGLETTAGAAHLTGIKSVQSFIGNIVGAVLSLISVVFFMFMLFAGIRWMTARGNEEAEKKARDTIFGGAIGMIIVMSAYALTNLVFNAATQGGTLSGGAGGTTGGTTGGTANNPTATAGEWCLTMENKCVKITKPDVCVGNLFDSETNCKKDPNHGKAKEAGVSSLLPTAVQWCVLGDTKPGVYVCFDSSSTQNCKDKQRFTDEGTAKGKAECEKYAQATYGLDNTKPCVNDLQCKSNDCAVFPTDPTQKMCI